ncbi:MAG TPA: SRPBCC domain-containing protein [Polyangiaceae bacterium]|jgi:uncharacterized protein YndB with AHSA1/START domain|nr:SRPBCC domain-containing protein [Polyangiaceae bacterium]
MTNRIEVTVSRTIPAKPEQVYEVWLDPKSAGSPWFGTARAIVNAVVDGLFYHSVVHEGYTWAHYGRFVRLDRKGVIEHTWVSEATRGIESVVTVTLEPKGDDTLLTLRHTNLPDDDMGRRHEEGWTYVTNAIAERFTRK